MLSLIKLHFASLRHSVFFKNKVTLLIVLFFMSIFRVKDYNTARYLEDIGVNSAIFLKFSIGLSMLFVQGGLGFVISNSQTYYAMAKDGPGKNLKLEGVLVNVLPVGRRRLLASRILSTLLAGIVLWAISLIPFLLYLGIKLELSILRLIIYGNTMLLLGAVVVTVRNVLRIGKNEPFLVSIVYTLFGLGSWGVIYFDKLGRSGWITYPAMLLLITLGVCIYGSIPI